MAKIIHHAKITHRKLLVLLLPPNWDNNNSNNYKIDVADMEKWVKSKGMEVRNN